MQGDAKQLGRYRLGDQIGAGGMAEVFRAEMSGAEGFSRPVAIKRVRQQLVGDREAARGFIDEARLAQRLQHGNIVQTYDLGIEGGVPYIVMEFVDGLSLSDVLRHNHRWNHRLGVADSLHIVEEVAAALDYAHRLSNADGDSIGVVHRDVNPRNILLSMDGIVKLTDFGIARAMNVKPRTLPGRVKGTLGYLSPEQAYGGIIGPPTDQFATGVVLYELLAGRNPLSGAAKIKEYRQMLDEGLPHLEAADVDDELRAIVARATASKPSQRFKSMAEFRQVLEAWRVARGIRTSLDGVRETVRAYRGQKPPKRVTANRLNNALLKELGTDHASGADDTRALPEAAPAMTEKSPARWLALAAALLVVVAGVVVTIVLQGGDPPSAVAAAPADAGVALAEEVLLDAAPVPVSEDASPVNVDEVLNAAAEARAAAKARAEEAKKKAREAREAAARIAREAKKKAEAARKKPNKPEKPAATGTGTLRINVLPYAEVHVDGKSRGRTPKQLTVKAGSHTVRLHNPGTGKTTTKRITLGAGETKSITSW